jgi:uncharacterized lipoprotein
MNELLVAITLYGVVVALSGCALTTDRIDIGYGQKQGIVQMPGANKVSVAVQVADLRQDKGKVSSKKNGYGMEMAPIVATEDVAVTIRRAIEQELRARGFQLAAGTAVVQIAVDLTRFYNDYKTGFFAGDAVADLNMSVTVKSSKGELLYTRQVIVQGVEQNVQLATGDNARLALNRALENGMRTLFEDQAFLAALVPSAASGAAS